MQKYLRGQVWWCKNIYDVNSGERELDLEDKQKLFDHIQKGMRPVLIVSNDTGNKYSDTLQVIPCTASEKTSLPTHCSFYINKIKNTFLCEQIKTINKTDLSAYLITLDDTEMSKVEECFKIALGIIKPTQFTKISIGVEETDKNIIINQEEYNGRINRDTKIYDTENQ